jgi:hypothetical protein
MITITKVQRNATNAIYVGRRMWRYRSATVSTALVTQITIGSVLCNPFRRDEHPPQFSGPIAAYADYLDRKLLAGSPLIRAELERIVRLALKGDITLACWCANEPRAPYDDPTTHRDGCHADIIANTVLAMVEQRRLQKEVN